MAMSAQPPSTVPTSRPARTCSSHSQAAARFRSDRRRDWRLGVGGGVDQLLIDRDVYQYCLASQSASSLEAFEWALGVNWYLNPNVKMQFDYEHTGFRYGAARGHDRPDENVLLSELQLQL